MKIELLCRTMSTTIEYHENARVAKKRRKKKRRKKSPISRSMKWHRDPIQSHFQAAISFITCQRRERAR